MKRRAATFRKPENSNSYEETRTSNGEDSDHHESQGAIPPARKILKRLLVNEVDKAVREIHNDSPTLTRVKEHRAASLIPEFDPDSEECTVAAWLKKIEQLGRIHNWDNDTKSFYLQDKLRGQARKWYNRLDDYDFSWEQWKQMLLRAFPKHRDYAAMIEEMINRKKLPSESMTKYYQEKIAMCFRCKLSDSASVSCIIRGLPLVLQSNARAFQCERPDELYEGFLSALDDYRTSSYDSRATFKDSSRQLEKTTIPVNIETDPCPRCKRIGHLVRNCPLPDQRSCFKCGEKGHIAPRCPAVHNYLKPTGEANKIKDVRLLQSYNDIYKKTAKVNGVFVKAYIDTGSQVNVLAFKVSSLLNLSVKSTNVTLKGFSGGLTPSQGEVEFKLEIDNVNMNCKAHLTDIDMNGINLLIGQPIINSDNVSLSVRASTAFLNYESNFLSNINISETPERFKVVTVTRESLSPGSTIIRVKIIGNSDRNNVVTPTRHYELEGVSYSLPATLLCGNEGYIKVINSGSSAVVWEEGTVLLRAENCEEPLNHSQDGRM